MNERIQKLAQAAEQLADDELAHLERVHNRLYSFTEGREIYNQKFAELLVEECCNRLSEETILHGGYGYNQHELYNRLRNHFGVKV